MNSTALKELSEYVKEHSEDFEETEYLENVKVNIFNILNKELDEKEKLNKLDKYIKSEIMKVENELAFLSEVPMSKKMRHLFSAKEPTSAIPVDLLYTSNVMAELENFVS